jgi:hypothetical protein
MRCPTKLTQRQAWETITRDLPGRGRSPLASSNSNNTMEPTDQKQYV